MRSPSPAPATSAEGSGAPASGDGASAAPGPTGGGAGERERAALGPILEPVSAAENPAPAPTADWPPEAEGRRTLSAAFVRTGPDGRLTVELRDGRRLVLRDVVMRPKDYCGVQVTATGAGGRYCGGYAEVAAARPGGVPPGGEPDRAAPNPAPASPTKRN